MRVEDIEVGKTYLVGDDEHAPRFVWQAEVVEISTPTAQEVEAGRLIDAVVKVRYANPDLALDRLRPFLFRHLVE